jgi:hypothetical protein
VIISFVSSTSVTPGNTRLFAGSRALLLFGVRLTLAALARVFGGSSSEISRNLATANRRMRVKTVFQK